MNIKSQPLTYVKNAKESSDWYQKLLCRKSVHGGSEYEIILLGDTLVLPFHVLGVHGHSHLRNPNEKPLGNGVVLWFNVSGFDETVR
jgi:hypothetical protein